MVRGVLERTRGDVTTAARQEVMKSVLREFEVHIGMPANDKAALILEEEPDEPELNDRE